MVTLGGVIFTIVFFVSFVIKIISSLVLPIFIISQLLTFVKDFFSNFFPRILGHFGRITPRFSAINHSSLKWCLLPCLVCYLSTTFFHCSQGEIRTLIPFGCTVLSGVSAVPPLGQNFRAASYRRLHQADLDPRLRDGESRINPEYSPPPYFKKHGKHLVKERFELSWLLTVRF